MSYLELAKKKIDEMEEEKKWTKCIVCNSKTKKWPTCGKMSCPGKLAASKRYQTLLRQRYQSFEKLNDMTNILVCTAKYISNKIIGESFEKSPHILEFFGSGTFREKAIKTLNAKVTSVDVDPKLEPIMKELNLKWGWGKLSNLIDTHLASVSVGEGQFDLIYLDYCGNWNEDKNDEVEKLFQKLYFHPNEPSLFFITLNRSREFFKGESKVFIKGDKFDDTFVNQIEKILPHCKRDESLIYKNEYLHDKNRMVTFGFKRGELPLRIYKMGNKIIEPSADEYFKKAIEIFMGKYPGKTTSEVGKELAKSNPPLKKFDPTKEFVTNGEFIYQNGYRFPAAQVATEDHLPII